MAKAVFTQIPPDLKNALERGSTESMDLTDDSRKLSSYVDQKFVMASLFEQLSTVGAEGRIVDEFASVIQHAKASDPMPVNADHVQMVRFRTKEDGNYVDAYEILDRWKLRLTASG
ncbi:hypothetical protein N0V86_006484 [Didymella sp. IMI 355093]|nr:hypothetical protein N0V86_006484 [Didymella sp. IMI 355093]